MRASHPGGRGGWWPRTRHHLTPPRLLAVSFLGLIGFGTLGLRVLPGLYVAEPLGWLDALFTATSAVCVTGLIVVDTATHFTRWGQAFLLLLIQLGGLGIVTLTTVVIVGLGRRLSLHHLAAARAATEVAEHVDYRRLGVDILRFTLAFEGLGAILLFLLWLPRFPPGEAAWHALFHSVSAFCNAGFSTFSDSLASFTTAPWTLGAVMVLVVAGGLGFLTIEEIGLWVRGKVPRRRAGGPVRLSVHSRLVLAVTAVLLVGGWLLFSFFEWRVSLAGQPTEVRLVNSLFMSVTARTAGFNTVDYAAASESSSFLTIVLMSIGGSPGSTAGGLKTTTAAVIGLLAWSRLRGRATADIWHRTIPEETIQRAVGVFVFAFGLVTAAVFAYTVLEIGPTTRIAAPGSFLTYMFEAASAFNTVGLSMGVTGDLSPAGRALTILLMYVGRVGPLTFAAAIALRRASPAGGFRYSYEDVAIG
jgi:trk system potassium uptake protein TrkH